VSFDGARTAAAADPSAAAPGVLESAGCRATLAEPPSSAERPVGGFRWSPGRLLVLVTIAALLVAVVRVLVAQAFVVPSASMEPGLHGGDRVLVSRLDRALGGIRRGDVIVFDGDGVFDAPADPPRTALAAAGRAVAAAFGLPIGEHDYVKRVIGLPGERVVCCDAAGRITVDGVPLDEPYLAPGTRVSATTFDLRVPVGRYWVMGDNREDSGDSRAHLSDPGGGTVPEDHVVGRVVSVWWPWGRATGIGRVDPSRARTQEGAP
jgi:signal peptidase I